MIKKQRFTILEVYVNSSTCSVWMQYDLNRILEGDTSPAVKRQSCVVTGSSEIIVIGHHRNSNHKQRSKVSELRSKLYPTVKANILRWFCEPKWILAFDTTWRQCALSVRCFSSICDRLSLFCPCIDIGANQPLFSSKTSQAFFTTS